MDALDQLNREKEQVLSRITEASRNLMVADVLKDCARLQQIESLINRYAGLVSEIQSLGNPQETVGPNPGLEPETRYPAIVFGEASKTGRELGRTSREVFLKKLSTAGIALRPIKGAYYSSTSGSRIGIAFATERTPDRWFLGLTSGSFDHAVLLCHSGTDGTIEICLPRHFFMCYEKTMSLSNGQIKFNVVRKGKAFNILIPGAGAVNATEFLSNYSYIQ